MKCTTIIKYISITVVSAAILVFYGCAKELDELGGMKSSEVISFTTDLAVLTKSAPGEKTAGTYSIYSQENLIVEETGWDYTDTGTKASPIVKLADENTQIIGYSATKSENQVSLASILFNEKFEFDGNKVSASGSPIYWKNIPQDKYLSVFAYIPEDITVTTTGNSTPALSSYTVPENASDQTDIAVATTMVAGNFKQTIPLQYDHIFTAVKFKLGFNGRVKSLTLSGVKNSGTYTFGDGWDNLSGSGIYIVYNCDAGVDFEKDAYLNDGNNTLMLLPQEFDSSSEAKVVLEYLDGAETKKITAPLAGQKWEAGRMMTYTIHKDSKPQYIYFDLAAGDITISSLSYSGRIYAGGEVTEVKGKHDDGNIYYVYQSTLATEGSDGTVAGNPTNIANTGWVSADKTGTCRIPQYQRVEKDGIPWSKWITENSVVENVIEAWPDAAKAAKRESTDYKISVEGNLECNLIIDNIYSKYQKAGNTETTSGLRFVPEQSETAASRLKINFKGDSRFGNIYYVNRYDNGSQLIFEGTGSLTVADVDMVQTTAQLDCGYGYTSNWWRSAIGSNDSDGGPDNSYGIVINSGTLYAGTTKAENASAIGGGGNGEATITINGGTITAVATTTGAAIGGGMAINAEGGGGDVLITGGNVYAYNFENGYKIPSAAIGGGGSRAKIGNYGNVTISGGNVFAYSVGGAAIGGGSSETNSGGEANVTITGGNIIAISAKGKNMDAGSGIGGGTGGKTSGSNGGNAIVRISGNPIIRTGSIGGGKTNNTEGRIGYADVEIRGNEASGPDIQAQFVMAKGSTGTPKFKMTGGTVRNSHTSDREYIHTQTKGGAVYMEDGELEMTGGTITNCSAVEGGAIYITGGNAKISGTAAMTNNLASAGNGGAICIYDGNLEMSGSANVSNNASQHRPLTEGAAASGGNGGGIYVSSSDNTTVSILQGTIKGNTADRNGGGIAVDMSANNDKTATITIGNANAGDTDPDISGNTSLILGGGLYASGAKADITINSGKIMDNSTSGYTYNVNVANEGGTVTLNGGNVTHQTVTFNANGGKINGADTSQQKIVTSTNSLLKAPEPTRTGYNFTGWNTRQDGNGIPYADGATMNLSADLTLYAQWQIIQ